MSTSAGSQPTKSTVASGIVLSMLSAVSFAATGFVANELADDGSPGVIIGFYEAVIGLGLVVGTNARVLARRRSMPRVSFGWAVLAAAGFATAFATFYTALATTDLSIASPILGSVPLVSYAVVLLVLRGEERITKRALLGAVLVVAGVGIIGVAN